MGAGTIAAVVLLAVVSALMCCEGRIHAWAARRRAGSAAIGGLGQRVIAARRADPMRHADRGTVADCGRAGGGDFPRAHDGDRERFDERGAA